MSAQLDFKCTNCGERTAALYRSYSPTVLKLSKCDNCGGIVDKYVEYDPVIVMIDLVLMSKEAQRHVIYNTEFKSYWKLFIVLMMLETYGVWKNDSLMSIGIAAICEEGENSTILNGTRLSLPYNFAISQHWKDHCWAWVQHRPEENNLFIWEKHFYILFISTFCGIAAFVLTTYLLMKMLRPLTSCNAPVSTETVLKAFSLANVSNLLTIIMLVWGTPDTSLHTRALHYVLVLFYSFTLFYNVYTVVYGRHRMLNFFVLICSYYAKYATSFVVTHYIVTYVVLERL